MSLTEQTYKVLIVSSSEKFTQKLKTMLPECMLSAAESVFDVNAAKRRMADSCYDFVIINNSTDTAGISFATDIASDKNSVVLLLVKNELYEETNSKVLKHGVFTLPLPASPATVSNALNWMVSARENIRRFEQMSSSVEQKMEEIRIVNRAKWLLITERNMTEPDAHRYIEKQAMDNCASRREIAEKIIKLYS